VDFISRDLICSLKKIFLVLYSLSLSEQSELLSVRYQWTRHVTVTVSSNVGLRFSLITLTSCARYTSVGVVELIRNMAG